MQATFHTYRLEVINNQDQVVDCAKNLPPSAIARYIKLAFVNYPDYTVVIFDEASGQAVHSVRQ